MLVRDVRTGRLVAVPDNHVFASPSGGPTRFVRAGKRARSWQRAEVRPFLRAHPHRSFTTASVIRWGCRSSQRCPRLPARSRHCCRSSPAPHRRFSRFCKAPARCRRDSLRRCRRQT